MAAGEPVTELEVSPETAIEAIAFEAKVFEALALYGLREVGGD